MKDEMWEMVHISGDCGKALNAMGKHFLDAKVFMLIVWPPGEAKNFA